MKRSSAIRDLLRRAFGAVPARAHKTQQSPPSGLRCSFCGKQEAVVKRLIAGPGGVYICNECVVLCNEILTEQGDQPPLPTPATLTDTLLIVLVAFLRLGPQRATSTIVIERATSLHEFTISGTRLDAVVSTPLLEALCGPRSPFSSGAVIVHGDRIIAAGCPLPSETNIGGQQEADTRHREAMGITRRSDAIAIVLPGKGAQPCLVAGGRVLDDLTPSEIRAWIEQGSAQPL